MYFEANISTGLILAIREGREVYHQTRSHTQTERERHSTAHSSGIIWSLIFCSRELCRTDFIENTERGKTIEYFSFLPRRIPDWGITSTKWESAWIDWFHRVFIRILVLPVFNWVTLGISKAFWASFSFSVG